MSAVTETGGSFFDGREAKIGLIASGVVLAFLVAMGIHRSWSDIHPKDPRDVVLVQTATLVPDKDYHRDGDDVAGLRPGQSAEAAAAVFEEAFGNSPSDEEASMTLGDMRSQPFANELWDLDVSDDRIVTFKVMLSSPSTANTVLSALKNVQYKGMTGYPDAAAVEAALVAKYGPPTARGNFALSENIYLTWVRGDEKCEAWDCQYASYSNPSNDDAATLAASGIPLRPVISARIVVRDENPKKVSEVAVRMTDYQMLAASVAADDAALGKAQAEFDKLTGPEIKF
jgi:hypothetical protein